MNNMPYCLIPIPSVHSVEIYVGVGVGSRDEAKERLGISHLVEHMIFKNNGSFPTKHDLYKELDRLGSQYNAFTSQEITVYTIKTHARHLKRALDVFGSILCDTHPTQAMLDAEKHVVCEEIRRRNDDYQTILGQRMSRLLYPKHPACRETAGSVETVQNITLGCIRKHLREFYVAENMYVCIAGSIDVAETRTILEQGVFNHAPVGRMCPRRLRLSVAPPPPLPHPSLDARPLLDFVQVPVSQPQLWFGFPAPSVRSRDTYTVNFIQNILVGPMTSRLTRTLREDKGYIYSIHASKRLFQDIGMFTLNTACELVNLYDVIRIIWQELRRLCIDELSQEEFERRRNIIEVHLDGKMERMSDVADYYLGKRLLECPEEDKRCHSVPLAQQFSERYSKLTPRDVRLMCKRMFQRGHLKVLVGYNDIRALDASRVKKALASLY